LVLRVALSVLAGEAKGAAGRRALIQGCSLSSFLVSFWIVERSGDPTEGDTVVTAAPSLPAFGRAEPTHRKSAMNGAPDVWATSRTTDQVYFGGKRPGESEGACNLGVS
jgi:hypothetical protein